MWHICDAKTWRNATTYEKDTFGWTKGTDGEIKKGNVTDSIYVFDKTAWRATSAVEAKLGGCVSAIADSVGKVGSTYYICKSGSWRTATALEYDTYKWTAGKDADSKAGSVNANNCYVYENKAWRSGKASDCSLGLRGCTALRQDTVGLGSDKVWHICDSKSWRNATTYEKDTFGWTKGTDGEIKKGNVTDSIYVYDATVWRTAKDIEKVLGGCTRGLDGLMKEETYSGDYFVCDANNWRKATGVEVLINEACTAIAKPHFSKDSTKFCENGAFHETTIYDFPLGTDWTNPEKTYGSLYDKRDGRTYKTIEIGDFVVMAENLNYADSSKNGYLKDNNWCYQDDSVNCLKGGRYYTWTAAMSISGKWQSAAVPEGTIKTPHQGICPDGWHIPTKEEWNDLYDAMGTTSYAVQAKGIWQWKNATNVSGFSALPAGYLHGGDWWVAAIFWSATESVTSYAYYWDLGASNVYIDDYSGKHSGMSVRCFKDQPVSVE